jgi:FtsP/CotA-like multicopper oxidase with cupredoxin domain
LADHALCCCKCRNGIKQRKNSWQDGVAGTNCPIPPGANYTYKFQAKDQIGTFTYFPSVALHRAAGGFGALNVYQRPAIPVPYPAPDGDFTLLVGDWYLAGHDQLRQTLDSGAPLPFPDALLVNGMPSDIFVGDQGRLHSLTQSLLRNRRWNCLGNNSLAENS